MFSIDATELVEKAQGVDFEALHASLDPTTINGEGVRPDHIGGNEPIFQHFINFCTETAIPAVTQSNPSRAGSVEFLMKRGATNDSYHIDPDLREGPVPRNYLVTRFAIGFDFAGNPVNTMFRRRGVWSHAHSWPIDQLSDEDISNAYTQAKLGDVTVFDPDRKYHAPPSVERVMLFATMRTPKKSKNFNPYQLGLHARPLIGRTHPLISKIPDAA